MIIDNIKKYKGRVIIYGAGLGGQELLLHLKNKGEYEVVGFIEDNKQLVGQAIDNIPIYQNADLAKLISDFNVETIIIAIPSLSKKRKIEIYDSLSVFNVKILTLPNLTDILLGKLSISDVHGIQLEDLLGRDSVQSIPELLRRNIENKTILVTGAGGSIGSEISRQIIENNPKLLILLDVSEYLLYQIDHELKLKTNIPIISILGSVLDTYLLKQLFEKYKINTVYHAAAYKHVPIVESNPFTGVINNFIGTSNCVRATIQGNAETFVLISTDKAVRPTNVMGASKRLSELICQGLANTTTTKISMVRFGNVIGSSGSVIPLFKKQIQTGGPLTVTHQNITRYFMTIPEAAQLVIQAGAMAVGGDVFLLDMGEPVKINELAKRMIRLSGLTIKEKPNDTGIEIVYTGLRPGEKLYEELLISGDNISKTEHPLIMKAFESSFPLSELNELEKNMMTAYQENNIDWLTKQLTYFVAGYQKSDFIQ